MGFLQSVVQLMLAEDAVALVLGEASMVQLGALEVFRSRGGF